MSKHIYLLSASDRFNYGDVLFPIVAKHELGKLGDFEFHNVATIESDLHECGAMPTDSYKTLYDQSNIPRGSTLVVAGGQVLNANWARIISFTKPHYHDIFEKYREDPRLEPIAKKRFGDDVLPYPFTPSVPEIYQHMRVVYHAVGGELPRNKALTPAIKAAPYFSAREHETQKMVKGNYEIDVSLIPDSVLVLSDKQPKSSLPRPLEQDYACVQFGFLKSRHRLPAAIEELRKVHQQHGLTIGLLSIGNCPGHDDTQSVEFIQKHADFPVTVLPCDTIDQITAAIAHAKVFIGTSLHGAIVSMSYGNPFVAVHKRIRKLDAYTRQWAPDYLKGNVDFAQIAHATRTRLAAHRNYLPEIEQQKEMVRQSFKRIADIANA